LTIVLICIIVILIVLCVFAGLRFLGYYHKQEPFEKVDIEGDMFYIYDQKAPIQEVLYGKTHWKPKRLEVLLKYLNTHKIKSVIIAYANVGALAVPISSRLQKAYLIEPDSIRYNLLLENIHLNNITNVETLHVALDSTAYQGFICRQKDVNDSSGTNLVLSEKQMLEFCCSVELSRKENQVSVHPLDSLGLNSVDAIILEVGFNYKVLDGILLGAKKYLSTHHPILILDYESIGETSQDAIHEEETPVVPPHDQAILKKHSYQITEQLGPVCIARYIK
jgi:FkbM family methyltransferase